MDSSQLQSLLNNSQNATADPLGSLLQPLMPILTLFLVVSVVLSIIFVVYVIVGIVQKQRQHAAIMRIDRNLQKLVDRQELKDSPRPDIKEGHPVILADIAPER